jgi:hypothetical protein
VLIDLVITKDHILPTLTGACPGWAGNTRLPLRDNFVSLAMAVVHSYRRAGPTANNLPAAIERLLVDGDDYVRDAVTTGLIDAIRHAFAAEAINAADFIDSLLPESKKAWDLMSEFAADSSVEG